MIKLFSTLEVASSLRRDVHVLPAVVLDQHPSARDNTGRTACSSIRNLDSIGESTPARTRWAARLAIADFRCGR
jgi:hypothetical protein